MNLVDNTTKEDNIMFRIMRIKKFLKDANIKKTGKNHFTEKGRGFSYFELADIVPFIIDKCIEEHLFTKISFTREEAKLSIINMDDPLELIEYTSPMEEISIAGANKIQSLGGVETYQRRYLYLAAFDIVEQDMFDSISGSDSNNPTRVTSGQIQMLQQLEVDIKELLIYFNVTNLSDLTEEQAQQAINAKLKQKKGSFENVK